MIIERHSLAIERYSLVSLPGKLPDAYTLSFDAEDGHAAAFARFGIAPPASILRSVPKRRSEYLAGRRAAVAALRAAGSAASDLAISASRAPCWPAGFIGSITHTAGFAAAVALKDDEAQGIGIDVERVATGSALEAISNGVIDEGEQRALEPLVHALGRAAAFTIAFSAKESFYKATAAAVGRLFDFSALRVRDVSLQTRELFAEVAEPLCEAWPAGRRVAIGYGWWADETVVSGFRW